MNFQEHVALSPFPRQGYEIDCSWRDLSKQLDNYRKSPGLDIDPPFQRAHVWTLEQQIRYIEYRLLRGPGANQLSFATPAWLSISSGKEGPLLLVDGKQRLKAVQDFLEDKFAVFGDIKYTQIQREVRFPDAAFKIKVCELTLENTIKWYLALNASGTPHTPEELEKAQELLRSIPC